MGILKLKNIMIHFLIFISFITCDKNFNTSIPIYRCGKAAFEPIEVSLQNVRPINPQTKRTLDNVDQDGFKDFNIYLDLLNFEEEVIQYNLQENRDLFVEGMTKAINTLKSLLRVKPHQKNWGYNDENILKININKWNRSLIGNETKKGMIDLDIDLIIFVRFDIKENLGEFTLANAGAEYLEPDTGKPLLGLVNINREVDYSKENSLQYFEGIIIHEFTHILGFSNYYFTKYFNNVFTKVDDFGIERSYINSTKVVEVGKKYFNCDSLEGIALEDYGGKGTVGSHWEARILLGDYMNGVVFTPEQIISEFTLALLEDSGYYKANYYTGGLMQFGKNKGCDFLFKKCIENGQLDPKYTNEFFYNIYSKKGNFDTSCSSDRQSRTYHIVFQFDSLDEKYQYFDNPKYGGWSSAEYCPVSYENVNEEGKNIYFIGHCSERGSGEYGSRIYYDYNNTNKVYKSEEIKDLIGESHSENSFCVLSSLISKSKENYEHYSNTIRAVCYQMYCSDRSLTIQINNDFIVCPRAGGKINAINYDGYLSCPDYNLICSGSVLCNDMFDCVEKKSLLKDNIIYDYETKTTQDLEVIKDEVISDDAYELSTNGKCCQYCSQCNELNLCIKCRNDYGIVEFTEIGLTKRKCKSIDELNNEGYYKNEENSIYYKCIDNCKECSNDLECITCKEGYSKLENNKCFLSIDKCKEYDISGKCTKCELGYETFEEGTICKIGIDKCIEVDNNGHCTKCEDNYRLSNNICYKKIEKCKEYEVDEKCKKCEEGYAFEENDRLNCKNINEFEEYYTKDDGLSYFKCDGISEGNISNCKKCNYNNNKLICNECKDNYILKDDENNKCYSKEIFINDKRYYYEDSLHIKTCSKTINNCEECEKIDNEIKCTKCENEYYFVDEDYNSCKNLEEINPIKDYYYLDNNEYYSCIKYNTITNCKKCSNKNSCNLCKEEYTFINNEKNICLKISDLGNHYFQDSEDNTIYRKCDEYINKCDTCSSKNICLSCEDNFGLFNDKKECIDINNKKYYQKENLYYLCVENIDKCEECLDESKCIKCISDDYIIKDDKCLLKIDNCNNYNNDGKCIECNRGYKPNDDKNECIFENEYCIELNNNGDCIRCKENYRLSNNICYKKIEKCEEYEVDEKCKNCEEGYAFEENDRLNCKNINEFEEYYTKDNGLSYFKCGGISEGNIKNCKKCNYNNGNLICNECKDNYIRINNDKSTCLLLSNINIEEYYQDQNDNNMYIKCSLFVQNCVKCNYPTGCTECNSGFIFTNDDYKTCYDKSKISLSNYYTNNEIMYYSCDITKYKNDARCFSLNTKQNIILTFLQIQIINNKLYCYMMTHSPLPKNIQIKISIDISTTNKSNNMKETEKREINFITNEDSDGSINKIITFTSDVELNDNEDVEQNAIAQDMQFNNDDIITKTITDNNNCIIIFNKNSELVDTEKVKSLINSKETPDFSTSQVGLISLSADKIEGCEFNLNSESPSSFTNDYLALELVSSEDSEDKVIAKCDTKGDGIKSIKCKIEEEADSNYYFKNTLLHDSENFISIDNTNKYEIHCKKESSNKTILIIIILSCAFGVLIIMAIIIGIICRKKGYKDVNVKNVPTEKIDEEKLDYYYGKKKRIQNNERRQSTGEVLKLRQNRRKSTNMVNNNQQGREIISISTKRKIKKNIDE